MDEREVLNKWIECFASNVDENFLKAFVFSKGNYLWHIFSGDKVPCLCGDAARNAFNKMEYDQAIIFESGFAYEDNGQTYIAIENLAFTNKIFSDDLDESDDTYVISKDYRWTYIHTHEEMCGPYFFNIENMEL